MFKFLIQIQFHAFYHNKDITAMFIVKSIIGDATRYCVSMCQQSFLRTATVTRFVRHLADSQLSGPLFIPFM